MVSVLKHLSLLSSSELVEDCKRCTAVVSMYRFNEVKGETLYWFYLILHVAVGGMYFVDSFVNGGYPRPWQWNFMMDKINGILLATAYAIPPREPKLIWEEHFDELNPKIWKHLVTAGVGKEFQYYRDNRLNSWTENGTLIIRPTLVSDEKTDAQIRYGNLFDDECNRSPCVSSSGPDTVAPVFSAYLYTQGTFTVAYSRIEIRAKLPRGDWLLPSIVMEPHEDYYYGWAQSGKIRISESKGNKNLTNAMGESVGNNALTCGLLWGYLNDIEASEVLTTWKRQTASGDFSDNFHIFEVERTPGNVTFFIDGSVVGSVTPPEGGFWELGQYDGTINPWENSEFIAPFDKPFYFVLNIGVGGDAFDGLSNGGYAQPWTWDSAIPKLQFYEAQNKWVPSWDRPELVIDYIRVFQL